MIMSGSNNKFPVGALLFERDGGIVLHLASDVTEEEEQSITLAAEFFQYSLQRQEWMIEFLEEEYLDTLTEKTESKKEKPELKLYLIEGGLSSGSNDTV